MDAAEYCLKYLSGTADLCIHYGRTKDEILRGESSTILPAPVFEQHRATVLGEDEAPFSAMLCRARD